ncbi:hypothetical protein RHEC894_PE00557 (plasmid) [Rhizobium sp. CIAT894]|nr:hypothetical protein RHEC894_PE00557 [Rhizobium sp. CIAT894]
MAFSPKAIARPERVAPASSIGVWISPGQTALIPTLSSNRFPRRLVPASKRVFPSVRFGCFRCFIVGLVSTCQQRVDKPGRKHYSAGRLLFWPGIRVERKGLKCLMNRK